MIESVGLTKRFDDVIAVDHISAEIREASVFGLVGTNGAGKSTFLRLAAGILKPDEGCVRIDGEEVYENPGIKQSFFYIPDDQYFFSNVTPIEMMVFSAISTRLLTRHVFRNCSPHSSSRPDARSTPFPRA